MTKEQLALYLIRVECKLGIIRDNEDIFILYI